MKEKILVSVLLVSKTVIILLMCVQVRDNNYFSTMYLHTLNIYIAKRIPNCIIIVFIRDLAIAD